nr:reverse transcriptase domain-containing protein [Tanacetum cinerariifolium]
MADQRTIEELLRAPIEGYVEAIVIPPILAEHFELKRGLINMMTSDQFFGLEKDNPHDHIRWFNKITSTIKYKDEDHVSKFINEFFPPSRTTNLRNEISNFQQRFDESFHEACDRYKDLLRACPHHGFTEFHQLDTFYNALNLTNQDSLNSATGGNLLETRTQDVLTIIENKSKVRNSRNKSIVSQVKSSDANSSSSSEIAKLTHAVNQQTRAVTTTMTVILKQFQATPPSASVKAVEEISGELKAITTRSGVVLDGPSVPMPHPFINPKEDERVENTLTEQDLAEYTIKVPPPLVQKAKPYSQRNYVKMLKVFLSNKEKLLELANTPLNENCSAVILKKLHEKLRDPGKFLIPCGFSKLKCKALADIANRAIFTPAGIARDVFVPVGKFTFPADFVIVDYESDPRVPLILERPFLQTARALIDVHGEEMILRDGDERLTLNMRHDTSSYSNQPKKESINLINIFDDSCGDYLENLFATNHLSGNPTFSSHTDLTSPEVKNDIFDPEGDIVLIKKLINLNFTKDLPPPHNIKPLSRSTTSSSPNQLFEEFADELALITFPPGNDDLPLDIKSDLREIEYSLNHDPIKEMDSILENSIDESKLANLNDNLFYTIPEMFIDEHALDYSSLSLYDDYDDDLDEFESDNDDVYDDPFDSKEDKIKESKLLINELDLPRSSDFLPSPEYDSFLFKDFSEVDALPSTNNEDKDFLDLEDSCSWFCPVSRVFIKVMVIIIPEPCIRKRSLRNGPVSVTTNTNGMIKFLPSKTAEKVVARERERKARTTLLMVLPEDHLAKFHKMADAKEMWEAINSRFGGNDESKNMQKYLLKEQFEGFSVSTSEGLHKWYDRFQTLLSQLEIHSASVSHEDANQNFLRSLPSSWSQVALI